MYFLSMLMQLFEGGNYTPTALCPVYSPFFGSFGIALAMCLTNLGSAYGIAKSSLGISSLGVMKPEVVMKGILPVIFAVAVKYSLVKSFRDLAAGLTVGLSGVAAGMSIGIAGDAGVRAVAQQPRMYVPMVLILIFSEALGLYGTIVAILLTASSGGDEC